MSSLRDFALQSRNNPLRDISRHFQGRHKGVKKCVIASIRRMRSNPLRARRVAKPLPCAAALGVGNSRESVNFLWKFVPLFQKWIVRRVPRLAMTASTLQNSHKTPKIQVKFAKIHKFTPCFRPFRHCSFGFHQS